MQRVDLMTAPPVVGRFYLVPTVHYKLYGVWGDWPVRGVLHEDRQHLDFPYDHYHLDNRFLTAQQMLTVGVVRREVAAAVVVLLKPLGQGEPPLPEKVTHKKRKCQRNEIPWPVHVVYGNDTEYKAAKFRDLHSSFHGDQCARSHAGWVCPHRGFPLGSIAVVDGAITCPLHGLKIDAANGVVIPHKLEACEAA